MSNFGKVTEINATHPSEVIKGANSPFPVRLNAHDLSQTQNSYPR
jgi:hypothetical protein